MRGLLLTLLAACDPGHGTSVLLTIDGSGLSAESRAAITSFSFAVTGAERYATEIPLGHPFSGRERILYLARARGGQLQLTVSAADGIEGSGAVELRNGETVPLTIALGQPEPADLDEAKDLGGADASPLRITAPSLTVAVTRRLQFAASEPVGWSVLEPAGGDIDAGGSYYAPVLPGTFHVIATSLADQARTASATVEVINLRLDLIAGSAGGPGNLDGIGAAARFDQPGGVCGIWVADTNNHAIRKVDRFDHNRVTTLAGNGTAGDADGDGAAARLDRPLGVACDAQTLYIADNGNGKIRKLSGTTLSTVASGFAYPVDVAWDGARNRLFVADWTARKIFAVALGSGAVTAVAGNGMMQVVDDSDGSNAAFYGPTRLAIVADTLLVVDGDVLGEGVLRTVDLSPAGSFAVRTVDTFSTLQTGVGAVSENQLATRGQIFALSAPDMGASYPLIAGSGEVTSVDGTGSAASFVGIHFLHATYDGVLVTDGDTLRQLDPASGEVTTLAGLERPPGARDGVGASLSTVTGLAVDDANHIYLADNTRLRRVDPDGSMVTLAIASPSPSPTPPGVYDVAWYDHALYLASESAILRYDPASGASSVVAGRWRVPGSDDGVGDAARFESAGYLVSDGQGRIYVSDVENNTIRSLEVASGRVETIAGSGVPGDSDGMGRAASFSRPDHLALDGKGALFVADRGNNVIRRIDLATRSVSRFAGAIGQSGTNDGTLDQARFEAPWGLACDGHSLYVTSLIYQGTAEPAVRHIDLASGVVSHFVGAPPLQGIGPGALPASLASSQMPIALALTPSGDLLVADEGALLVVH